MRSWFARHGPDAKNGGTSYSGYCKWIDDGMPMNKGLSKYKGAVSWLNWGGDAAQESLLHNLACDLTSVALVGVVSRGAPPNA